MNIKPIAAFSWLIMPLGVIPAAAETWKCDLVTDFDKKSRQHIFTRAGPDAYIHTTDVGYGMGTDEAKTVTETRNFKVAAQTLLEVNLVYSDGVDSPRYATLFSAGLDSPVAMLSRHVGHGYVISQQGACKVACTREDRQRIVGSETVCDSY